MIRSRTRILVALVVIAIALATASTAWACTTFVGQTYINGATSATAKKGSVIDNITGDGVPTGEGMPPDGSLWNVIASASTSCCYPGEVMATGAVLNRAATPDLGPVSGVAPTWNGSPKQKTYQVCFLPASGELLATSPAYLTLT